VQLKQLRDLEAQLHEVNQELARAALPLMQVSELGDEERRQVGARLRSGLARWEAISREISQVLQTGSSSGV
jgi:hypothetical protein